MKLIAPAATSAVSFAGTTYTVGSDGAADLPEAAAAVLIESHGFTPPPAPPAPAPAGKPAKSKG